MASLGVFVLLEAKPGKESEAAGFLKEEFPSVEAEAGTTAWFAVQLGPTTFGVFGAFPDEESREAHLSGAAAQALKEQTPAIFAKPPAVNRLNVLAAKLPG